ncbi:MAG: bis-aminopropyl spermidine synthase family protein [Bifidobacteriaceae bacterium]|jgi:predicted methyltransferase|nr:bis-aminopropyl spermidine synthase family protein [Bifidobacteriaceae bacterium]
MTLLSSTLRLANEIARLRPEADHSLEQFLLTPESMAHQVQDVQPYLQEANVVMIGDDDHLSLLFAQTLLCSVTVYELDPRVVGSINAQASSRHLRVTARRYDVRTPFPDPESFEMFYVDPPYSSKNQGLGVLVWLTRALEACRTVATKGIAVLPNLDDLAWTRSNLLRVQDFLARNGCIISDIQRRGNVYQDTRDDGVSSCNFFIERVDSHKRAPILGIDADTRIYR